MAMVSEIKGIPLNEDNEDEDTPPGPGATRRFGRRVWVLDAPSQGRWVIMESDFVDAQGWPLLPQQTEEGEEDVEREDDVEDPQEESPSPEEDPWAPWDDLPDPWDDLPPTFWDL